MRKYAWLFWNRGKHKGQASPAAELSVSPRAWSRRACRDTQSLCCPPLHGPRDRMRTWIDHSIFHMVKCPWNKHFWKYPLKNLSLYLSNTTATWIVETLRGRYNFVWALWDSDQEFYPHDLLHASRVSTADHGLLLLFSLFPLWHTLEICRNSEPVQQNHTKTTGKVLSSLAHQGNQPKTAVRRKILASWKWGATVCRPIKSGVSLERFPHFFQIDSPIFW